METEISSPELKHIPASLFSRKNNKTTTLINNTKNDFVVEGKHRWFEFEFSEYLFVQEIQIHATGYADWNAVSISLIHITGKDIELQSKHADGKFVLEIGRLATGFRFRPDERYNIFTNQLITSVIVVGYTQSDLQQLELEIASINLSRIDTQQQLASIVEREQTFANKVTASEARLNELKQNSSALDKEIGQATAQLDTLKAEINQSTKWRDDVFVMHDDLKNSLDLLRAERRSEETLLSEKKSQKAKLIEEIRLFPSEISGFVQEANRNIASYVFYSIPFTLIIIYVTYHLFYSAVDFMKIQSSGDVKILNIFVARLPFVSLSITILLVCGAMIKKFINEIVEINNQRLNLSAISIVAKDVSVASYSSLEISPDEKFDLEAKLKMSLLREQMRKYVSEKYEYKNIGGNTRSKQDKEKQQPAKVENPD